MGTVGLSFGSPTSGAGFDVSSTVAEIVGNLQNVETPWKSQLTSLESQDTAISSLGTLFSSLSNDISSLTDLQGILAQKVGSSSDTNVLELTAASSSAVAGTHSVVVNNLAQTSSGYLAEITNSADKLSGSITLQAGSGKAQTIILNSSDDSLAGLASAINASGAGITASVLTDATGSRLSLVSGTSGAGGNIAVTNNSLTAAASNTLSYTGTAGTSTANSAGALSPVSSLGAALSGTMTIQVGSGTAIPVDMSVVSTVEGGATLSNLESYINSDFTTQGVQASIVANSDGTSSLHLNSEAPGSAGTLTVNSSLVDPATALSYASAVTGVNANLTVDGVNLTSASNTVTNLIPGVTFQLLAPSAQESGGSLEPVQVVIGNDNADVESTVNQFVSDYNSLVSAVNAQEGNTSSGTPEPLFGSPTLSLLQQQLLSGLNTPSPNGYLDSISADNGTTLSGSMTIQAGSGPTENIVIGAAPSTPAANTIYTGSGSGFNTLAGIAAAINSANPSTAVDYTPSSDGTSGAITASTSAQLSGTLTIATDTGSTETIYLGSSDDAPTGDLATGTSDNTLSSLESFIASNAGTLGVSNVAIAANGDGTSTLSFGSSDGNPLTVTSNLEIPGLGVTAAVSTLNGESTLTFAQQTAGSNGALTVTSALSASAPTPLSYKDSGYTSTTADSGTLGKVVAAGADVLSGSLTIQVGGGTAENIVIGAAPNSPAANTIYTGSGADTLSDVMNAIGQANLGVSAALNSAGTGLTLTSSAVGAAGALIVTSNLVNTTSPTITPLNYSASSDINNLTSLGISVNNDGSLTFDVNSLDSLLNTDYSGVVGFFQSANSWGQAFANTLNDSGTGSTTRILGLARTSNSTTESTLNAEISREQSYISAQQTSLTAELNSANEIMQQLPSQLDGINELYSAITGYDQNVGG